VAAARTQIDEPPEYAPLRLISEVRTPSPDPEGYTMNLDAMCTAIAQHLVAHFGQSGGD
jgi:hypothetical protein